MTDPEEITLYVVQATVTDTQGIYGEPGKVNPYKYVTGLTRAASIDDYEQVCEDKGFRIESPIIVEQLSREQSMGVIAENMPQLAARILECE